MILVVGSTGWLGGEICKRLRERGYTLKAVDRDGQLALVRASTDPANRRSAMSRSATSPTSP